MVAGLGIGFLTLYAFSTENWNRPKDEVDALMKYLVHYLKSETKELNKNNVRLEVIGQIHRLPENVQEHLRKSIETLSKGFKQRVGFAQALLHDPAALVLDEPTDGLDPNQKNEVRSLIKSMAAQKAVILSTHILEEVDAIRDPEGREVFARRGEHGRARVDAHDAALGVGEREACRDIARAAAEVGQPVAPLELAKPHDRVDQPPAALRREHVVGIVGRVAVEKCDLFLLVLQLLLQLVRGKPHLEL